MMEKGLEVIINLLGIDAVEELAENFELTNELLYGEDEELTIYLPFEGNEITEAEILLSRHIKNKFTFEEEYEEQELLDVCRRLVKTYESNEMLEMRLFVKILSGISGKDLTAYF